MNKDKALLVISFGSSYEDARKSIENVENYIASRYEDYDFYRAFTSRMIVNKLKKRDNISVDLLEKALEKLYNAGYKEVICQSLHVINGIEYDMTLDEITKYQDKFEKITLGMPLLTHIDDYEKVVQALSQEIKVEDKDEAFLLMGHGTEHFSNACYSMLEDMFQYKGYKNVFVATVEGFPEIDFAITKMKNKGIKKVTLMPFMIVAGDHAKNDMAGDEEDSWKTILQNKGFEVNINLKGLGDNDRICELFYQHTLQNKGQ